ncbi:MAG: HAD-IA family hydrolase [Deltaproteobacteria bacterium]|nr:HAD-IA family hydrolase [Deltaproteobacteria bacterium]
MLPLPVVEGLIFDLDGTLVDSAPDLALAINLTRERFDMPPLAVGDVARHVGHGAENLVRHTVVVEPERFAQVFACYMEIYQDHLLDHTKPYPGVEATLKYFKDKVLGVVTNKPYCQTEAILQGLGLFQQFDMVIGGDTLPTKKPDPAGVRAILEQFGLAPGRVVMVGDSPADVQAGRGAGTLVAACLFGLTPPPILKNEQPDFLLERMDDLTGLLA